MGDEKPSFVSSSMVDLKAELYRKQEEFRNQKASSSGYFIAKKGDKNEKKSLWSKKNKGVVERSAKDQVEKSIEEDDALEKSKRILEEKAKLYAKITSSVEIPEEDGSDYFLVDFQKKAIDAIVDEKEKQRKQEEEEEEEAERRALDKAVPPPETPDEEWVDFKDFLGRSRRCLRKDLAYLKKQDQELARTHDNKQSHEDMKSAPDDPTLMSQDMYREKMRKKWEEETQVMMEKEHGQMHYSNVRFDEIRSHGVGFYDFSKDHETREEQLQHLNTIRTETKGEQSRKEKIKDKRKALMEARLAKVRQRRNLKAGPDQDVDTSQVKTESEPQMSSEDLIKVKVEQEEKEKMQAEADEKRKSHLRDWDQGKQKDGWGHRNYTESRREERESEFAPPSAYFTEKNFQKSKPCPGISDKMRMNRLQKSLKSDVNPDFAPPASYTKESPQLSRSKVKQFNTSESCEAQAPGGDLTLESIPLPPTDKGRYDQRGMLSSASIASYDRSACRSNSNPAGSLGHVQSSDSFVTSSTSSNIPSVHPSNFPSMQFTEQHTPETSSETVSSSYQYPSYQGSESTASQFHQQLHYAQYTGNESLPFSSNSYTSPPPDVSTNPTQNCGYGYNSQVQDNPSEISGSRYAPAYPSQVPGYVNDIGTFSSNPPATIHSQNNSVPSTFKSQDSYSKVSHKRQHYQQEHCNVKKPKIPKSFIMDTRFVQNEVDTSDETTTTTDPSVSAVPYTPGSFTAARLAVTEDYENTVVQSRSKNEISGGPMIYTAEQIQQQLKQKEEEDAEQRVTDFLSSIK